MAPGEPQWLPEDTELALEWQAEKRAQCADCGHHLDESTDPGSIRDYEAAELVCQACAVIGYRRTALQQQAGEDPDALAGVRIYAQRSRHGG